MKLVNPYWINQTKIQMLQRWILVHSILYYELDTTIISDQMYDKNGAQLVKLMQRYPKDAKKSRYAYAFKKYEGSTGFDLYKKLKKEDREWLLKVAHQLKNRSEKA